MNFEIDDIFKYMVPHKVESKNEELIPDVPHPNVIVISSDEEEASESEVSQVDDAWSGK